MPHAGPQLIRTVRIRLTALVAAVVIALAGCAGSTDDPEAETSAPTTWSFTDDLGKTVTLDAPPTKVAGLSDVLYSLMSYGIKPVAGFGWLGIDKDPRFDGLDKTGLAELGVTYGEIDIEALAAAAPDVIVTNAYPNDASGTVDPAGLLYGFKDAAQQAQAEKIAPIITIKMAGSAADVIKRTTELAVALGAPADTVAEGKAAFDAASAKLTASAARGIEVQVIYAEAANVYVAKADDDPALTLYQSLGVKFVKPITKDYYWDIISWEKYDSVGGDIVLYSQRGFQEAELMKQPTFAATAAAKAGQVHPWVFAGMDYVTQAAYVTELAGFIDSAQQVA
ncbi:MAG: ABC transporter substrate-binding protein [Propionibacteriaceae bacterium]